MMLERGDEAPQFRLFDQDGVPHSLADYGGKIVVIYFYPKDYTPGCTKQACALRDVNAQLEELGAVVLGISADSVKSHKGFSLKHKLNFSLLADPTREVIGRYGATKEQKLFSKSVQSTRRSTFVIDRTGKIAHIIKDADVATHDQEVLAVVSKIG